MKTLVTFLCLLLSVIANSQTISVSKLLGYADLQNQKAIGADLKSKGFVYRGTQTADGIGIYTYTKAGRYGTEELQVGKNDELYMIVYQISPVALEGYRAKLVTDDFVYTYSFKQTKYYENGKMRVGINETASIVSCFVKLK